MSFMAKCSKCNATCSAEDEWIGQEAECPECGATIIIEKPVTKPSLTLNKPNLNENENKKIPVTPSSAAGQKKCPYCQCPLNNLNPVICISCGTNLKTGKKIATASSSSTPAETDNSAPKGNIKGMYGDVLKKLKSLPWNSKKK